MSVDVERRFGSKPIFEGTLFGHKIVAAVTGVGKVNSSMVAQRIVDEYSPEAILFAGIAGSINPLYKIGDIVVASDCLQHDIDVEDFGSPRGDIPGEGSSLIMCSPQLLACIDGFASESSALYVGRILTGDQFLSSSDRHSLRYLRDQMGGDAVEMEGAGVGYVAAANGIPFLLFRVISDLISGEVPESFPSFISTASYQILDLVRFILERVRGELDLPHYP